MPDLDGHVVDLLGSPIKVGDQIAGSFRIGNIAVQRVGTVIGYGERANKLVVRVQWHHDDSGEVNIVGSIEADLHRFVKINR